MHDHLFPLNTHTLDRAQHRTSTTDAPDHEWQRGAEDTVRTSTGAPYLSELTGLSAYLFGADKLTAQRALEAIPALCMQNFNNQGLPRLRWLRREFIRLAISLKRDELDGCLVLYRSLPKGHPSSVISRRSHALDDDQQTMLHRLVLIMTLREGCAWRDSSRLLQTTEAVIECIFEDSLRLL